MEDINLTAIKRENIGRIFEVLKHGGLFSRAELSQETGISLMTVGKIVDLLEKNGILVQIKRQSETVGRKSLVCKLDDNCVMMIFDLSSYDPDLTEITFKLYVVDILLDKRAEYALNFENLNEKAAEAFMNFAGSGKILGIGCILPSSKNANLSELSQRFIAAFGRRPDVFENDLNAAAIANSTRFDAQTIVYLKYTASESDGFAVVCDDKIHTGSFGRKNFSDLINLVGDPVKAIAAICLTVDPELIIIQSENEICKSLSKEILRLSDYVEGKLPEIVIETQENRFDAVFGVAFKLCKHWLDNII